MNEEPPSISIRLRDDPRLRSYSCQAMACTFNFHLIGSNAGLMDSAVMEAEERLAQLEERLSFYIEHSDTTRINRAATGETIRISEDTVQCLLLAFDASARLLGKFHPFMGKAAIEHKGQQNELPHLLGVEKANSGLEGPVIALDEATNSVQKLRTGPLLDLGGIGKGFALDQLRTLFLDWEIEQGLLECGGSAYLALKPPPGADGWELTIGYEEVVESIQLVDGQALASSGVAFQGSHVIDPDTESPRSDWQRSYASAPTAALADAASTAALLLQPDDLSSIAKSTGELSFALFATGESMKMGTFFQSASQKK